MSESTAGSRNVLIAGDFVADTFLAPPEDALRLRKDRASGLQRATFAVTYTGFSNEAKAAFQAAVDVWAVSIASPVTITIAAEWAPLAAGLLGSAGAGQRLSGFTGAPYKQTWYPVALANKLVGKDQYTAGAHIKATFNSARTDWYFGTDGKAPRKKYDLMSVVLHEIGHGLGFSGTASVKNGIGKWGDSGKTEIWDCFIENGSAKLIIDTTAFPNPSKELAAELQGGALYFNGAAAKAANGNTKPLLYAPKSWNGGSSFSHLDEDTYPAGDARSLMTPTLGTAEAIHSVGAVTLGMLRDLGW